MEMKVPYWGGMLFPHSTMAPPDRHHGSMLDAHGMSPNVSGSGCQGCSLSQLLYPMVQGEIHLLESLTREISR